MQRTNNVTVSISTASVFKVLAVLFAVVFVYIIRDIVLLLVVAVIFAAIIEPLVSFLETKRIPRVVSVSFIYIALLFGIAVLIRLIIPPIIEQITLLSASFPELYQRMEGLMLWSGQSHPEYAAALQQGLKSLQAQMQQAATGFYS